MREKGRFFFFENSFHEFSATTYVYMCLYHFRSNFVELKFKNAEGK